MARHRQHGEDLTVAEWHRHRLPELYERNGHRLDMANRDWTEFCHYCKEPLAMWEDVVDRGQDLRDKGVRVTRRIAERADIQALHVAARIRRPHDVQATIDKLHAEIRRLEAQHPILHFTVRRLYPNPTGFVVLSPDEFAAEIYLLHREHHLACHPAQRNDPVYQTAALRGSEGDVEGMGTPADATRVPGMSRFDDDRDDGVAASEFPVAGAATIPMQAVAEIPAEPADDRRLSGAPS